MAWQAAPDGLITEHFAWSEAACRHCGRIPDVAAVRATAEWLERLRALLEDRVVHVNGWCRCDEHDAQVGGAHGAAHARGLAVDVTVRGLAPHEVYTLLAGHTGAGGLIARMDRNAGFTHIERAQRAGEE